VTTSVPDVQDLYIERLNPDNPNQYEYMGEWHDMEIVEEVIRVNGGEDVVLPVRLTRRGPIVTEQVTDEEDGISDVLSVRWTAFEPSRILQSVVLLNRAQNYDDFFEAMRYWDVPSQSIVYADVEGNIAYFMSGRIPIRKNGDGAAPAPGWTDEYEWEGWIPHEELPSALNPEKGFIVTANNAVVDSETYPYHLAYDYSTGDRAQRIMDVLQMAIAHGDKLTVNDFTRLQMDNRSLPARALIPLMNQIESDDPQIREALDYLTGWDLQEDTDSVAAALWEMTFLHLPENAFGDEVGADNLDLTQRTVALYDLAENPDATWWDDTTTPQTETAVQILEQSLAEAIAWLEENQGGEMADWTWGSIHTITFEDGVLGQSGVGVLEATVNRGPFAVGGGSSIVNANSWSRSNPAAVRGHPSMRMVVDMGDLTTAQAIHPTGQSGHPYHPHYDDMTPLWLAGEYHPMLWEETTVAETAVDALILQPAR
jgi:penicillin amidase